MGTDRAELERVVAQVNRARRAGTVVDDAIAGVLDEPDCRLVAYGTLRPGEANEHVLAAARGTWSSATVTGALGTWHGYPMLRPGRAGRAGGAGDTLAVMVLESADLPGLWPRLDRFEGPAYRREWIVYECDGVPAVGSVYVAA